jgi:DUF4097 and DUF4098 domain-containing protein YvlB
MKKSFFNALLAVPFLLLVLAPAACNCSVNKSLSVADGETMNTDLNTVNGSVKIGRNCIVKGSSSTVNGSIKVDNSSQVGDLKTVNGSIKLADKIQVTGGMDTVNGSIICLTDNTVTGNIETVNGRIECGVGTSCQGNLETVNGAIEISGTQVAGMIKTLNGNITLQEKSEVKQSIIIEKNKGIRQPNSKITITIDNSVVNGDIISENNNQKDVEVIFKNGGKVLGQVKNAVIVEG